VKHDHDEELDTLRERVKVLEVCLTGVDGQNGLRSELRELKRAVESLRSKLQQLHVQIAMYVGGAVVIIWLIEKFVPGVTP
jgi:predicted  nucleic acid-binding Zn-ribbon protein